MSKPSEGALKRARGIFEELERSRGVFHYNDKYELISRYAQALDEEATETDIFLVGARSIKTIENLRRQMEALKISNRGLVEALKFYADEKTWDPVHGSAHDMSPRGLARKLYRVKDFGERARYALKKWGGE